MGFNKRRLTPCLYLSKICSEYKKIFKLKQFQKCMIIKNLQISEIKLISLDSRQKTFDLEVNILNEPVFRKKYNISEVKELPERILRDIIKANTPEIEDSDDILDTICSVNIKNDEEHIKDCLLKFVVRLDQRLKNFAHSKEAFSYMKEYNSLRTYQEIVYRRD